MSRNFLAQLRKISPPPQDSSAVSQIPGFYFIAGDPDNKAILHRNMLGESIIDCFPSWNTLITTGAALSMFQ